MRHIFAVVLALFGAANAGAADATVPQFAEAAAIVDAFHAALSKGDRAGAQAVLDDNVQIYEQGWVERSKAEYVGHHLASDIEFSTAITRQQTARGGFVAGDVAYVTTEDRSTGTFKGKAIDSITLETMVLRHTADAWKIVHVHWSSRSAKK